MIYNKFLVCKTVASFESSLAAGDIVDQHIVFIEETGKIWTSGKMYGVTNASDLPSAGDSASGKPGLVIVGDNITVADGVISISKDNVENALGFIPVDSSETDGTISPEGQLRQLTQDGLPIYPVVTSDSVISTDGSESLGDQITNLNTLVSQSVKEAPEDSKIYVRKNGEWVELTSDELTEVNIEVGDKNVQADWKETDVNSDAYIKNKPTTLAELGISEIYETRGRGSNSVTTLAGLPVDKSLILATLNGATSISLASDMNVGESVTIVCTPSSSFTQPLPTTGSFVSMDGDSLSVTSGVKFEINILCIASSSYSISCKVAV